MAKYHDYVFNTEKRTFIGDFELMYANEDAENFDSWHQDDMRDPVKQFILSILAQYNFSIIYDVDCGKGAFTNLLKKQNNSVFGYDISPTAVVKAQARFPDISFDTLDISDQIKLKSLPPSDLTVIMETLSYIEHWASVIENVPSSFLLVSLYIPDDPIGFVKTREQLVDTFRQFYRVIHHVEVVSKSRTILFGKRYDVPNED